MSNSIKDPTINLLRFCLLKTDSQHAKFQFRLENFKSVEDHVISRIFLFSGHQWKLQLSKKNGLIGMYLRWYGPAGECYQLLGPTDEENCSCTVNIVFAIVNIFNQQKSIVEGQRHEDDIYEKVKQGIGYSSMIMETELLDNVGYVVDDSLYLHLELKVVKTAFHSQFELPFEDQVNLIGGYDFHNAHWSMTFYPEGDEEIDRLLDHEKEDKIRYSSIYLQRVDNKGVQSQRHNVRFRIMVPGRKNITLDKHFCDEESNWYGNCKFIPVAELQNMESFDLSLVFEHVVPYFYFALNQRSIDEEKFLKIHPLRLFPHERGMFLEFRLLKDIDNRHVTKCRLVLVNYNSKRGSKNKLIKQGRKLQICWYAEILCPRDVEESVGVSCKSKRMVQDYIADRFGDEIDYEFPVPFEKLFEEDSRFVDEEGNISVRISVYCCNIVSEDSRRIVSLDETFNFYQQVRRSLTPPPCQIVEKYIERPPTPVVEEEPQQQQQQQQQQQHLNENDFEKDLMIKSLSEHLNSSYDYIQKLERHPVKARSIRQTQSLGSFIKLTRLSDQVVKHLALLAKKLENILYGLPVGIEKVLHSGPLAQGTLVATNLCLDFVLYLEEYRKYQGSLPLFLQLMMETIKQHASKSPSDLRLKRTDCHHRLPFISNVYQASNCAIFRCGDVTVSLLVSQGFRRFRNVANVYKKAGRVKNTGLYQYIVIMSYLQVKFVASQTFRCKELICVVKSWSDDVLWRMSECRPGSYLLALLVIHSYNIVEQRAIARTPSFDLEVMKYFEECVSNENIIIEWNLNYNSTNYPYPVVNNEPFIRDPAIPYHNVAKSGLKDWSQLRKEARPWIESLTF